MTTAKSIIGLIAGASAVTLAGGYCVRVGNGRTLFEPAAIKDERRNKAGRVTYSRAVYKDGSAIIFRYSAATGASWKAD